MASPVTRDASAPPFAVADITGQAASENFPVASRVLPRALRQHLLNIYGFARLIDDIGDEAPGDRNNQLDWAVTELRLCAEQRSRHPLFLPLGRTIATFDMDLRPFLDLIEANRMDQVVTRYETFEDLVGYCMKSAAPVGRLVLRVLGRDDDERVALSDRVCIGLQVVEHIQDVGEDFSMGRVYIPLADLTSAGCSPEGLTQLGNRQALCRAVQIEVQRARELLASGPSLAATLPLRARVAVAAFGAGGESALDAVEAASFDVISKRCKSSSRRFAYRWLQALAYRGHR
ncbi:MAG: squalene synthase HpnC [Acidimicrobiales bacterium]